MSSHAKDKYEGWSSEQFREEIARLEVMAADLELQLEDAEDYIPPEPEVGFDLQDVSSMYEAFYLGREGQAIEIAKRIDCAHTGRLL